MEQIEAFKSGRIDVGFGRVRVDADGIVNRVIQEEPLVAVLAAKSALVKKRRLSLQELASQTVIVYPAQPRPSFADQVLVHFRARGWPIAGTFESNGLQSAVGMAAAGIGVLLVPGTVQWFRRDDIVYRPISDVGIVSPMLMTTRVDDHSQDLTRLCDKVVQACATDPTARFDGKATEIKKGKP